MALALREKMVRRLFNQFMWRPVLADVALIAHRPSLVRIDGQALRIAILLVVVALLNGVDLLYTLFAQQNGMLGEMNPIAANFLGHGLEPSLISYKILCVLVASALLWRARKSRWTPGACWVLVLLYVALSITWLAWTSTFTEIKHAEMTLLLARR